MRSKGRLIAAAALLALTMGTGCGDDDGGPDNFVERAQECGVLTAGDYTTSELPDSEASHCVNDCYVAAPCEDYDLFFCGIGSITPATQACFDACIYTGICDDGSGPIAVWSVCDGYDDCTDGSDEVGCTYYPCDDGSEAHVEAPCDGYDDCMDGSDEDGCPTFQCADGSFTISATWVCDTVEDCDDGSDEAGSCAQTICQ